MPNSIGTLQRPDSRIPNLLRRRYTAPMTSNPKRWRILQALTALAVLSLFVFLQTRNARRPGGTAVTFTGRTMGTLYSVKIAHADLTSEQQEQLQARIEAVLTEVNRQMSTYIPTSEISQFNRSPAHAHVSVSKDFSVVVEFALEIARITSGAFDPTVGPLVNLWGFGPDGRRKAPPTAEEIAAARSFVGFKHLQVTLDDRLVKDIDGLYLDLGAVAKGFGVDEVLESLIRQGYQNVLVEIGGETRAYGTNAEGTPWRIGVQRPNYQALPGDSLQGVIELSDGAIATSGDYQNFFKDSEGEYFSHIIDPRTARPAGHALASVSVFAETCMLADALATALYVLGPDEGLAFIESYDRAEALFVVRESENSFREIISSGFAAATGYMGSPD